MAATIEEQTTATAAAAADRLPAAVAATFAENRRAARERGVPAGAVRPGDRLPDFTLPDANGSMVRLSELLRGGPAVLVFYRGGWCPYCNIALRTYERELLPMLSAARIPLVAISPQSPDQSLSTAEKAGLSFTVLSDSGAAVAHQLGIAFEQAADVLVAQRELGVDLTSINAAGAVDLPMPTVLIVDADRTVRFVDTRVDYTARTEVDEILAALARPPVRAALRSGPLLMRVPVTVTTTKGPDKLVSLPTEPEPYAMGMHDELAEFYEAQPGFTPHASTLDYVIGALAACLAGTFKRAVIARGVPLVPEDLTVTAVGEIIVTERVPVIRSVEVSYVLANSDPADKAKIERAHAVHDRACAVSRSVEGSFEVRTTLELT